MTLSPWATLGTVSHGTHRPEDLIPAFLGALETLAPGWHARHKRYAAEVLDALASDERTDEDDERAAELVNGLADALDRCAPAGAYFGAHPGDGADFGFWEHEDYGTDEDGLADCAVCGSVGFFGGGLCEDCAEDEHGTAEDR